MLLGIQHDHKATNPQTWRAITSTDQDVAWECYVAMLEMDGHLPVMNFEDWRVVVELEEKLEDISLDDQHPD